MGTGAGAAAAARSIRLSIQDGGVVGWEEDDNHPQAPGAQVRSFSGGPSAPMAEQCPVGCSPPFPFSPTLGKQAGRSLEPAINAPPPPHPLSIGSAVTLPAPPPPRPSEIIRHLRDPAAKIQLLVEQSTGRPEDLRPAATGIIIP